VFDRTARSAILVLCLLVLASMIAAHASLIGMGSWEGDEYYQAAFHRDFGADYWLNHHIFGKSPRPVSEMILVAYFAAVNHLHRALISPFLAILWVILIASAVISLRLVPRPVVPYRLLLALSLVTMFLVGHGVCELFFWPVGAAAYLTTLAATTFVFFLLLDRRTKTQPGQILESACLVIAAACSEAGAMFILTLSALRLPVALWRPRAWSSNNKAWRAHFWSSELVCWSAPLAMSLFSLYHVFFYRVGDIEFSPDAPYLHLPFASLLVAIPQFIAEFVGLSAQISVPGVLIGLLVKTLYFVGFRWCWQKADPMDIPVCGLLVFALALMGGAYLMIAAAYYQFGFLCCERHDTLRQCWFILALVSLAIWSARFSVCSQLVRNQLDWLAPILIVLAPLIPFAARLPDLVHDYGLYPRAVSARSETWESGLATDVSTMKFHASPNGKIIQGFHLPPGQYVLAKNLPWEIRGVMLFFHKQSMEVLPDGT
jgi:hypothetical protein